MQSLPNAPATERNKEPILAVLREALGASGLLLEVASGLGEHCAHFARAMPAWVFQPTECAAENLAVIEQRVVALGLDNLRPPLVLDAASERWPVERADAVFNANLIHISPWETTPGLFRGAARILPTGGLLVTYGPYAMGGAHTAQSNADFDVWLKTRDARFGVRDLGAVEAVAAAAGFALERRIAMPANNFTVLWRRSAAA